MQTAGYLDFTKRDLRNFNRVMKGFLPADVYVKQILDKYHGMHGAVGVDSKPCVLPKNYINTRDAAVLNTVERKIYPARLVWEFCFGSQVALSAESLLELHKRLCGDIYESAGQFRCNQDMLRVEDVMLQYVNVLKSGTRDVHDMCHRFESLLADLLTLNCFEVCNQFTCMVFVTKLAYFWGYTCKFEDSGVPGLLLFNFSDRLSCEKCCVRVA